MKTFQKSLSEFCYILLCVFLVSCSDSPTSSETPLPKPDPEPNPVEKEYELADNVIELEGNQLKYISSMKGDTLVYESTTPTNQLPNIGEIILVTQSTDVFPYGFLGKVMEVSQNGNVITEAAALDETFLYLNVEGTYELESADMEHEGRVSDASLESYKITNEYSVQIGRYISGSIEFGLNAQLGFKFHIDKRNGKNIRTGYVDAILEDYFGLVASLAFGEKDEDDEKDEPQNLGNGLKLGKIVVGAILIEPVLQPYIKPQLEGSAKISWSGENSSARKIRMNFDGDKWTMAPIERDDADFDFRAKPNLNMVGSAFVGPGIALELRLYGNKNIKVALNTQVGIEASGEISLATDEDDVYDTLKDSKLSLALKGGVGLEASAKVFLLKLKWEHMFEKTWNQWDWYIFPSFSNESLKFNEDKMLASMHVGQNLLWDQEVGLALYNGDECVELSEPVKYKNEEGFKNNNPIEQVFEDISVEDRNNHSVWSYVKWGDTYIKCKQIVPMKKIKRWQTKIVSDEYSDIVDSYYFYYKNDSIDKIVQKVNKSDITYKFNYLDDGTIKVVGAATGESTTYTLNLNDEGYIKSCKLLYVGEGTHSIYYDFEYDEAGHMICMKCSEGNETWKINYENSDATSVTVDGKKANDISYGNQEGAGCWMLHEYMYGVDVDDEMEFFGFLGMLGKPSKHLPSVNRGIFYDYVIRYNWTLDSDGYPDKLILDEGGYENIVMDFSWE